MKAIIRFFAVLATMALTSVVASQSFAQAKDEAADLESTMVQAEQGHASARVHLGIMYEQGIGVPQNYSKALKWYRLAAEQGRVRAQTNLGTMYAKGRGVAQDYTEAAKWYRLAAEQGETGAEYNLGLMYLRGHGVPRDAVIAHMFFDLAALKGKAHEGGELAANSLKLAASKLTPAELSTARAMAKGWREKYQPNE